MILKYIEFVSTVISLLAFFLGVKQRIVTWPISITLTIVNLYIYHQGALYHRWISSALSIFFSMYGWYKWRYGGHQNTELKAVSRLSFRDLFAIFALGIIFINLTNKLLIYLRSDFSYIGSFDVFFVLVGLWMTANKKLEAYITWGLLNILSIYINYCKGYYLSLIHI